MKTRAVGPVFLTRDEVDRWDWPNIAGVPANSGGDLRERMLAVLDETEELRAKVAMLTEALAVTMSALGDSDGDLHCPTTMKTGSAALAATSEDVAKWREEAWEKGATDMLLGLEGNPPEAWTRRALNEHDARVRKAVLDEATTWIEAQAPDSEWIAVGLRTLARPVPATFDNRAGSGATQDPISEAPPDPSSIEGAVARAAPATTEAKPPCARCGGKKWVFDRREFQNRAPCPDCTKPEGGR